jgi:excinuclease ABC subunit C
MMMARIIYVGKPAPEAAVRSYFQRRVTTRPRPGFVANIADLEYILTDSEVEALIIECNLIKSTAAIQHQPAG